MNKPSKSFLEEKSWEQKARENPLYGVMSEERFSQSGAEPTAEEFEHFYARGGEMVAKWVHPWMQEVPVSPDAKILEFGCGMGRLTNALTDYHPAEKIAGIDISETMINHAKRKTSEKIDYAVVDGRGLFPFESETFARIYSYAVFQHISRKSIVNKSIEEISRLLMPGGLVKLNFEMIFIPPFENAMAQDTFAFECNYITYGFKKISGVPCWGIKKYKSTHWSGIRMGYKQLIRKFKSVGIEIYGIQREPASKGMVWFYGKKIG